MDWIKLAEDVGFEDVCQLNMASLQVMPEVREMCAADRCRHYNKSWACPPACGSLEEWQAKASRFTKGILMQTVGEVEDSFDIEGYMEISHRSSESFEKFADKLFEMKLDCLPMTVGGCTRCKTCTYPDAPCRFPEKRTSSMEACGLMVNQVCTDNGVPYNYGKNKMCYTSCLLFNE